MPWQHQFQFAGYYAAQAKGFYREAGLDVTLRPAMTGTDVVNEVTTGNAQFGISGSDLLLARASWPAHRGAGLHVAALATGAAHPGAARYSPRRIWRASG
ncbi:ABC transporter substrate-binding protein [Aeromonas sp. 80P]